MSGISTPGGGDEVHMEVAVVVLLELLRCQLHALQRSKTRREHTYEDLPDGYDHIKSSDSD